MKTVLYKCFLFFLPVLCMGALSGCGDEDLPDPIVSTSNSIRAVVNGMNWEASNGKYRLGTHTITNGASAFVGAADTLTIIGVQVQGADTTAIMLSVKLDAEKVGSYRIRSGATGPAKAYFFPNGISAGALQATKEKYKVGITNGELRITQYDRENYSVSGNFGFSMSATGETTYTVIAGEIENVTF